MFIVKLINSGGGRRNLFFEASFPDRTVEEQVFEVPEMKLADPEKQDQR